jgi:Carboxypeptidase regulatory-like domain
MLKHREDGAMRTIRRACVLAFVALLTVVIPAPAQVTTGSVGGTVKDTQGGVVPGATVVLISEARGTRSEPATTNATGDFVFPNVTVDTYTIEVTMPSFRTLRRTDIPVSAGSRVAVGTLTLDVGGAAETVQVTAEAPVIQAASGERSFTIPTESVQNLPLSNRSFTALADLAPGVTGTAAAGTRANMSTNFTMDGISTMDTGSNTVLLQMNTESIAEVKLLVSGYQAEYGRSSGLQVMAVTKSGTNRFRGSVYDVERNSKWNANSKQNILNNLEKTISKQKDWGYSIGGPIGKPGGNNKLFFFNSLELRPRTAGNDQQSFRVPTALERAGDFSQTLDNNNNLYPYIKDPQLTGACNATTQAGCFADGGVLGRIPASRLYQPGLNVLKMFPMPTSSSIIGRNLEFVRPPEDTLSYQPAVRFDYQPFAALRVSYKFQGQITRRQVVQGSIPGWNNLLDPFPIVATDAVSVNYNLNQTTFVEGTFGRAWNKQGTYQTDPISDARTAGLANFPLLFPDANIIDPDYYAYEALNKGQPQAPYWDGTRVWKAPTFSWGGRIVGGDSAPPNVNLNNLREHPTKDVSISLTKVAGRHTLKTGFYINRSIKRESVGVFGTAFGSVSFGNDTANPLDTSFGFANAAIGSFTEFSQANKYTEGTHTFMNREAYVQDNWKASDRLTLDYGVRFVNATPLHDQLMQGGNWLPERWSISNAPQLYTFGCANGVYPCTGNNRQAMNPVTGQFLGPNTAVFVGTLVPNSGDPRNALFAAGQGIAKTNYTFPKLVVGPRFGMAYDVTGKQRMVVRGGIGVYFDRPRPGDAQALAAITGESVTIRYSQLQTLGSGGLTTRGASSITAYEYDAKLPTATAWNAGMQMLLPWATSLDVAYTGRYNYNAQVGGQDFPININTIDIGTAFNPALQDPTLPPSAIPGASSLAAQNPNQVRGYRGYGAIQFRQYDGWRKYHALELALNRRFRNGLQFGFNDTLVLSDTLGVDPRYDHGPDGQRVLRADQAQAQDLLGDQQTPRHNLQATVVWQIPDIVRSTRPGLRALGLIVNDWQLSGIWTGTSGSAYTIVQSYQTGNANVNLTGSPDFAPRIRVVGDPGKGCSSDLYRQFNTAAFQGPQVGSVGLESGNGYLFGCFQSVLDLSIARNIRLGGGRNLQLRVDMFNAPNSAIITDRARTLSLSSPADPVTPLNLPFGPDGNVLPNRVRPNQAGFGAATNFQAPRTIQGYIRFGF